MKTEIKIGSFWLSVSYITYFHYLGLKRIVE